MAGRDQSSNAFGFGLADDILRAVRGAGDWKQLRAITRDFSDEIRCRHFALVTHEDLRRPGPGAVDLRDYAAGAERRIIDECRYRRDPVMRGCLFADSAFLWSELRDIITLDHHDRIALELGRREGLNEGITVPCGKLGHRLGSCTFAGFRSSRMAQLALAPAQMFGVFAFQRARRLTGLHSPGPLPRLAPRYRDCVVLAGRGLRNKLIAHRLGLSEDTVESYLRDARKMFDARDRTELIAAVLLAGEITLDELRHG
ncbi:LuxR family transcriptional regulator [Sphingomonas sp. MMSM20]|uniref:helix-turn-helix transcriptional regulator n=1 Tax=Sphingomonas lycopersici TaxID=2951807 RepID=UPI0022373AB0|nr:LuxR family transcriptional regulator [Sphingomonas lycopersici]MCW6531311.1 LuxR family transcriptional regulator [Sphingomonas lycopersici]